MKIAIVSAVYPPEPMVDAQTSSQLAEELARKGHSVQVYAPFPNRPAGKLFDGYRRTLFATSTVSPECTLTHCLSSVSPKSTMPSRFVENLSFGVTAGLRLLCDERPDVIYSNTWPIIASGIVAIIAVLRRIPLVLSVQDAYPESLASQKRMKNSGWCYKLVRQCDRMISHSAKEVIVISQRFRELYESDRGVDPAHLHMVLNWSDEKLFVQDRLAAALFRQKLGIPKDAFVAVCAGNIGVASDAEILVDAFARLKDRSHVYLLLAGDGARLGVCREKVEKEQLDRVIIHSPWKTDETAQVLQMADVLMLPTRGRQSLASIPSKLIGYLLSARPVIAGVLPESDTATTILGAGAGWIVDPDSVGQMVEAISLASEESEERLSRMGAAGQRYAMQHLTRASNLPRVIAIVENAASVQSGGERRTPSLRGNT